VVLHDEINASNNTRGLVMEHVCEANDRENENLCENAKGNKLNSVKFACLNEDNYDCY
jgi:hypothetical protein